MYLLRLSIFTLLLCSLTISLAAQSLDEGSPSCVDVYTIDACPFTDEGNLDGDNDCVLPGTAPYNDVFYRFSPAATGAHQFRLRLSDVSGPSLRIVRTDCCDEAIQVAYSAAPVSADCEESANSTTYLRTTLSAGQTYYFHLGTSGATASYSHYEFQLMCVECPREESTVPHYTCQTAETIALNDSLIGDSSNGTAADWYRLQLSGSKKVRIFVGAREIGHCLSGAYPSMPSVDARFSFYAGDCANEIYSIDDEGCSGDGVLDLNCLAAGLYFIRVNCYGSQPYLLKVTGEDPDDCPLTEVENQHCAGPCVGPILDMQTFAYPIPVPRPYIISDLNVRLTLSHTRDSNLILQLVTPWGDTLDLSRQNGGDGDHYIETVFDDEAALYINQGTAPFTGSFQPQEALSAVDGLNAQGTWKIVVSDRGRSHQGYLECVCLEFDYDVILNVDLLTFDARAITGGIELNWSTASESNNEYYEIERDGEIINRIEGAGTVATPSNYSYLDRNISAGHAYHYRLYSIETGGSREHVGSVTAVAAGGDAVVTEFALYQNFPNPFNPETSISLDLPEATLVQLKVYNPVGQLVRTILNREMQAGTHTVAFDGGDLAAGIYIYRLEAGTFSDAKKMVLVK